MQADWDLKSRTNKDRPTTSYIWMVPDTWWVLIKDWKSTAKDIWFVNMS